MISITTSKKRAEKRYIWETQGIHKRVVSETLFMTGNAEKQHKGPSIKD